MKRFMVVPLFLFLCAVVDSLPNSNNFLEGSCSGIELDPIKYVNKNFLDSLTYIPGASKNEYFRMASAHPRYATMLEDEFFYDFCVRRNISSVSKQGSVLIFGDLLLDGTKVRVVPERPEVYIDLIPKKPRSPEDYVRAYVTLTDNKTFAVVVACRNFDNVVNWLLLSNKPEVEAKTKRLVEDHVTALGFNREYFIFYRYNACNKNATCKRY